MNIKLCLVAGLGLFLSNALLTKDYLISTHGTSLLITANTGEQSERQIPVWGVQFHP